MTNTNEEIRGKRLYRITDGHGSEIETFESKNAAINYRSRNSMSYPDIAIEIYVHLEDL